MSRTIYIVGGYYSDYDAHNDWNVLAFTDPEKAEAHKLKCETRAKQLVDQANGIHTDENGLTSFVRHTYAEKDEILHRNEFDPQMQTISGEVPNYYVTAVTLED